MAFRVATGIATPPIAVRIDVEHDLRAGRNRALAMRFGIGDVEVANLGLDAAELIGLFHEAVEGRSLGGSQHDHAGADGELRIEHAAAVFIIDDEMLFKAEGGAEPVDRPRHVAIAQRRDDGGGKCIKTRSHLAFPWLGGQVEVRADGLKDPAATPTPGARRGANKYQPRAFILLNLLCKSSPKGECPGGAGTGPGGTMDQGPRRPLARRFAAASVAPSR